VVKDAGLSNGRCRCNRVTRRQVVAGAGGSALALAGMTPFSLARQFAARGAAAQDAYEVAVIRWDPADIYFNGVQLGQELERQRIEQTEGVTINFTVVAANDAAEQIDGLNAQLARGVDGVLLAPWRGEAMRAVVSQMREQGIPVVTHNAVVPEAPQVFVAFDNVEAGALAGQRIVERLEQLRGSDWASQGGVLVELRCIITASFDIGRYTGWRSVVEPILAENPNLQTEVREAGCDGGEARKAVDDLISRYGDEVLAVFSVDGTMGVGGAVPALDARGMLLPPDDPKHVPIGTVDATTPELQAIARGQTDHASVQPAIGEGTLSMRLLYQMMRSGQIIASTEAAATPIAMATPEGEAQETWQPVAVQAGENFDGPWYKLNVVGVPGDLEPNDQRLWANFVVHQETGEWPDNAQGAAEAGA
jgi:ABC-type sugar transport system substrate-binding protein